MLDPIAENAALAWPLALTLATVLVADRVRAGRRRERLNRALHELRRPLQALTLSGRALPAPAGGGRDQLGLAIAALDDLDLAVNGGLPERRVWTVDARTLAEEAVGRWRRTAALAGRRMELRWRAGRSRVVCEPAAIARALDNLLANALEHGRGPVRLDGTLRAGHVRLLVSDGADAGAAPALAVGVHPRRRPAAGSRRARDPRRGHGLRVVADVAAAHGGRFASCRHEAGACAVLELPLADVAEPGP
jgi:signal transduction histidine kinase